MESTDISQFADRTFCPNNRLLSSVLYCSIILFMESIGLLFCTEMMVLYLKVADLVMCLALQQQTAWLRLLK